MPKNKKTNYKDSSHFKKMSDSIESADRHNVIASLKERFLSDKWMTFENYTDKELKAFFLRLLLESRDEPTSYNKDVTKAHEYGHNIPQISTVDIDMLKICKNAQQNAVTAKFLDLGCGMGAMSWKAMVAGCKVHSVDISFMYKDAVEAFSDNIGDIVPEHLHQNIEVVSRSVYELLPNHPTYLQSFDAVYTSRVLDFQSPRKFNAFATTIYDLLKPGGKAYIVTNSINILEVDKVEGCQRLYQENKANNFISPGYMYLETIRDSAGKITRTCSGEYQVEMMTWDEMPESKNKFLEDGSMKQSMFVTLFDTETLEKIFTQVGLKVLKTAYLDNTVGASYFSESEHGIRGAVISLEKPINECSVTALGSGSEEMELSDLS